MCSMRPIAGTVALLFLCFGCKVDEPYSVAPDDVVFDTSALVDNLRTRGASVEMGGSVSQPFFSVGGQIIRVNGEDVQTFEYGREADAQAEAARVSTNGFTIGTTMVSWVATPHFFRAGRVIAIYVGDNQTVLQALRESMGPQFAGG